MAAVVAVGVFYRRRGVGIRAWAPDGLLVLLRESSAGTGVLFVPLDSKR